MLIHAIERLVHHLGNRLLGPVQRAADLADDRCAAAILAELRWAALAPARPGRTQAFVVTSESCRSLH